MELAADAIRGHRSAHSLATGPVMADPAQYLKPQIAATHNMNVCQPPMHITLVAVQSVTKLSPGAHILTFPAQAMYVSRGTSVQVLF